MRKFTIMLLWCVFAVFAQDSVLFANEAQNDTLVVDARIIEIPGTMPPNDLYNYVYVMKYRVIKVIRGEYSNQEILVGHYNPLIPRRLIKDKMKSVVSGTVEKFEKGAKHNLVLVEIEKVWNDAVENEYFDSDLPVYFAITADKKM
ncbi:MAG: hypothetical protein Q4F84_04140 [Fibrobacter sp.]|nr:hypothetical protein [Fibrobacter sp.]